MTIELIRAMESLDEDKVLEIVSEMREQGANSIDIMCSLNRGMLLVGKRFEEGVYYLADLIVSGSIYRHALAINASEHSAVDVVPSKDKIVIGVVRGDIHDIGKDIVIEALRSEGFMVVDLGINVAQEDFIIAVKKYKPTILALSGTMTFAVDQMEAIIQELTELKMRNDIFVIVGGIAVNKTVAQRINADYYSEDPIEAIAICRELLKI